jgi:uncharacterized protein
VFVLLEVDTAKMNMRTYRFNCTWVQLLLLISIISSNSQAHPTWQMQKCDPQTPKTREFIESLFSAVALDNFGASFAAALSDDLVWTVTGSSPIAGRYEGKQVYINEVLSPIRSVLVSLPVPIVEHIVVDGSWCTVVWRSEGVRGKNGADYDMKYAWIMNVKQEDESDELKIVEVVGFYDGQKVTAVFEGYDFPPK